MEISTRIDAAIAAFLAATRWSPRRLSVEAGCGQSLVARRLGGANLTVASADAILKVIRAHAPDTPEGRRARALATLPAPPVAVACETAPERAA